MTSVSIVVAGVISHALLSHTPVLVFRMPWLSSFLITMFRTAEPESFEREKRTITRQNIFFRGWPVEGTMSVIGVMRYSPNYLLKWKELHLSISRETWNQSARVFHRVTVRICTQAVKPGGFRRES